MITFSLPLPSFAERLFGLDRVRNASRLVQDAASIAISLYVFAERLFRFDSVRDASRLVQDADGDPDFAERLFGCEEHSGFDGVNSSTGRSARTKCQH